MLKEEEKVSSKKSLKETMKLDMASLKTFEDFDSKFQEIADIVLNETVMVVNKVHKFRIAEIEFYFNDMKAHPDTFCHGDSY